MPSISWIRRASGVSAISESPTKGSRKSTLNGNIKRISAQSWELINHVLLGFAKEEKIEKGRTVRTDCTCVESNIHDPSDSTLLWDGVRVLTRLIEKTRDDFGIKVPGFANHTRRAKRRMLAVMNAKSKKQRKVAYTDLLKMADNVLRYSRAQHSPKSLSAHRIAMLFPLTESIENYMVLLKKVVDQQRGLLNNRTDFKTVPCHTTAGSSTHIL